MTYKETNKKYTQEEVIAYAIWASDNMFNNSTIEPGVRKVVLEQFRKEITAIIEYDKEERALDVVKEIENR